MNNIKYGLVVISLFVIKSAFAQVGFVNNGLSINIEQGAYINMHDFTNTQVGSTNGTIDIDGTMIVNGDFNNLSTGNVFTNIEAVPNGNIVLAGNNQSIQGATPIFFENLVVENATKTLDLSNCEVEGILTVDGVLDLNHNLLKINNSSTGSINHLSGYIKSEALPGGLSELEWKIGDAIGTFSVPFGSGLSSTADLDLILKTLTAASPANGSVVFATYPTGALNTPLPTGISSMDTFKTENLADRFWEIKPLYTSKPDISIGFKYTADDVDQIDNPGMTEANLKAIRFNDVLNKWNDIGLMGNCDVPDKIFNVDNISASDFFTWWTLTEFHLKIPNAFTPLDVDNVNDVFLKGYKVTIVNRWGQNIFEGTDGWDGTTKGNKVAPGTYYYIAIIPELDTEKPVTGVITVVTK